MSTVKQIESALEQLPVEELQEVRDWLDDFIEDQLEIHVPSPSCESSANNSSTAWTEKLEERFRELAKKEALATISIEECEELERLATARRQLTNPRTAKEITHEKAQSESLKRLLNALSEYIGSHEIKNPART